jgi:hypothetical protein
MARGGLPPLRLSGALTECQWAQGLVGRVPPGLPCHRLRCDWLPLNGGSGAYFSGPFGLLVILSAMSGLTDTARSVSNFQRGS